MPKPTDGHIPWAKYEGRELQIKRKNKPPFEQWESLMVAFNQMAQSSPFWRGDLYLKGEEWYGEDQATSIFDDQDWNLKTWQNNASVCRRIKPSRRRELSYSHHAEVAYLDPELQEQYLQTAIDTQLSVRKLRTLIQGEQGHERKTGALGKFLDGEADKIANRLEEADGDVKNLMRTAVESLQTAAEVQKDSEAMPQTAIYEEVA